MRAAEGRAVHASLAQSCRTTTPTRASSPPRSDTLSTFFFFSLTRAIHVPGWTETAVPLRITSPDTTRYGAPAASPFTRISLPHLPTEAAGTENVRVTGSLPPLQNAS